MKALIATVIFLVSLQAPTYDLIWKPKAGMKVAYTLRAEGKLQREGEVVHVIVQKCYNLTKLLKGMAVPHHDDQPLISAPQQPSAETDVKDVFYKGRNFR